MTDSQRLDQIKSTLEKLVEEISKTNDKVEIYQKASQQLVNLAFSLILTATIAIVLQTVINN